MNHIPKTISMLSRRRVIGQVFLGSAAALALTACGGGSSGSDSGGGTIDLLDKYKKLRSGMTQAEVTALVGREADDITGSSKSWSEGNQILDVFFNFENFSVISTASWQQVNPSKSFSQDF